VHSDYTTSAAARKSGVQHIMAINSQAAVGATPQPSLDKAADAQLQPMSVYGRSKAEMERVMREVAAPVPFTMLRPSPAYRPRDKDAQAAPCHQGQGA